MNICHFTLGSVNPDSSNGINKVLIGINKALSDRSVNVIVVTVRTKNIRNIEIFERDGFNVIACKSLAIAIEYIKTHEAKFDVYHIHNVWSRENIKVAKAIVELRKPYVISPHSGLSIDRVKGSNYIFKKCFHWVWQEEMLNSASILHALCHEEASEISSFSKNNSFKIIPNGINESDINFNPEIPNSDSEVVRFGFIGRIAEEKNIHGLINALSLISPDILKKIKLDIIGDYNSKYGHEIKELIKKNKLTSNVTLYGALYGKELIDAREKIDVYTHVSLSEGASLSIIEALANAKFCILSRTSNISYYYDSNAFIMCEPLPFDISNAMLNAISVIDSDKCSEYSQGAINLVKDKFMWNSLAEKYIEMYEYALSLEC